MDEDDESVAQFSDDEAARRRHAKYGRLPPRIRPEDWVEEVETDPPVYELEQPIPIVQHPGRINET
jgi:hypothetical protein